MLFFCPAIPRYQGPHQHVDTHMLHPKRKLNVEDYSVHIVMCKTSLPLWASCQKSWPVRALITTYSSEATGSSSSQI